MTALGPSDLVLCSGSLMRAGFREKAAAARDAGFAGLSIWVEDIERAGAEGLAPADVKALLADHGLRVAELDPLLGWLAPAPASPTGAAAGADALLARSEEAFYEVARSVGGRALNLAHPFGHPGTLDLDRAAEAFAGVCARASEHGLMVLLEFLPWTAIPDLPTAAAVVARAGHPAGAVMLDTWHLFRSGGDAASLRAVPGRTIGGVQINGAPARAEPLLPVESMRRRLLPDEGDFDVAAVIAALDAIGVQAPIGVEVFSDALAAQPPGVAARRCAAAAHRVIARARSG